MFSFSKNKFVIDFGLFLLSFAVSSNGVDNYSSFLTIVFSFLEELKSLLSEDDSIDSSSILFS